MKRFFIALCLLVLLIGVAAAQPRNLQILRDAETETMLHDFSRRVFASAGLSPNSVRFILLNDNALNAFVMGGQNIFINSGLLLETDTPDELIGVIAHETGHIAGGHLFRAQERFESLSFEAMLASVIGMAIAVGGGGEGGLAAASAGQAIAERMFLRHSRAQESAADQAGVSYLRDSGLPLTGFARFMEKISSQELLPAAQQSEYVRTHPLSRDRVEFLERAAAESPDGGRGRMPAEWTERHARIKAKLAGYLYPDRALGDKSDTVAARYGRATAYYRRGRMNDALAEMDALLKQEPQNPYFHEFRAQILFDAGRAQESLAPYARAVAGAAQPALIRISYGHALLEAAGQDNDGKKMAEAENQLKKALADEPRISRPHRLLATLYGRQGREGLAQLHLAEEAFLQNRMSAARTSVMAAQRTLDKSSPAGRRAADLMAEIVRREKEAKKRQK